MLSGYGVYPTLPSKDIDAAKSFWVDTLGFSVLEENDGAVVLEAGGGSRLCLYPSSFAGTNQATACAFEVDDIDGVVDQLRGKGVDFQEYDMPGLKTVDGIATWDDMRAAWFSDGDGNIVGIFQPAKVLSNA